MSIAYYNGRFQTLEEVKIPLTDRALFFGDGVYEALIARNNIAHFADRHFERFFTNAKVLGINVGLSANELDDLIKEALLLANEETATVYFQLTKYSETRIHACPITDRSNLLITVTPQTAPSPEKRTKLVSYPDLRYRYCNLKTLNLLPSVIASEYAARQGADEAVLHRGETVTECAKSNISIISGGILYTHPNCELILPGIMRRALLEECANLGIPKREEAFTLSDLFSAEAVLVTGSTKICAIAESVDGREFEKESPQAILLCKKLHENFIKMTTK